MKVYPNSYTTVIEQSQSESFMNHLRNGTEGKTDESNNSCTFIGEIQSDGFRVQRKFVHYNGFRPDIVGVVRNGCLRVRIQLNRFAIGFLFVGYLMIIIAFHEHIFPALIFTAIVWSTFWYLLGWVLYSLDYKKTKLALEDLIKKINA